MKKKHSFEPIWFFKLRNPEYWPTEIIHFIPGAYQLFHILTFKNKAYPLILNPSINENGGLMDAQKSKIMSLFPDEYTVPELQWNPSMDVNHIVEEVQNQLGYPCYVKPENLYRGIGVQKINHPQELMSYFTRCKSKVIIQAAIDLPEEYAVFVIRLPNQSVKILSITYKEFLTVTGNGIQTIQGLLQNNFRYLLAKKHIDPIWESNWQQVPSQGKSILIQPIGNHNKGTCFKDVSQSINAKMEELFNQIVPPAGLHYGRFDVKAQNLQSLENGKGLKIIEFNGSIAEPVSYLDPSYSFLKGQQLILRHLKAQKQLGRILLKTNKTVPDLITYMKLILKLRKQNSISTFTFEKQME